MNLGEKIYDLRTKKNLSQGDIADALDVSRQSVSKWENNNAVPDLDKIVKLAEIFEVSLDELVLDKEGAGTTAEAFRQAPTSNKKTGGTVLLCTAALILLLCTLLGGAGGLLLGLLFATPFAICAVICFKVRNYTGLWCAWTFYFCGDLFLYFFTGIHPSLFWSELRYIMLVNGVITGRLIAIGILGVITLGLVLYTIRCFVKIPGEVEKKRIFLPAGILLGLILAGRLVGWYMSYNQEAIHWLANHQLVYSLYRLASILSDWGKIWAFVSLVVSAIKYLKRKKEV